MNVKDIIATIPKEVSQQKEEFNLQQILQNVPEEGYDCKKRFYKKRAIGKAKNISGILYTYLIPLFRVDYNNSILTYWLCKCKCGNLVIAGTKALNNGDVKSCGCYHIEITKQRQTSDLIGKKFNHLLILEATEQRKHGDIIWKCLCDCGKITYVMTRYLKTGDVSSCGCFKIDSAQKSMMEDRAGKRYGILTAIRPINSIPGQGWRWECVCDCGAHVIVKGSSLTSGHTQSCGCLKSTGELKISQLLTKNNIPFIKQKTFFDCYREKNYGKLHYDFYVNNDFLLEYDGIQHYKPVDIFGGEEDFKRNQERDIFKNNYAKNNNIPLKRIPYWDINKITIEDIMGNKYLIT